MNSVFKVVHFPDGMSSARARQFHKEIESIVEAETKIILLDLKNVKFINSSGFMDILLASIAVRSAGGKLFICSMSEQVRMLFELTGVDQVFETFANLDEFNSTMVIKSIT